jgi:hypothetical protein
MARTFDQIYSQIDAARANYPALSGLNSVSATAVYKALISVFASAGVVLEQYFDLFKQDLKELAAAAQPGTAAWLATKVKEFQYSTTQTYFLTYTNGTIQYNIINPSDRIVTNVAVVELAGGGVLIKTAKTAGSTLVPLSNNERNALQAYMNRLKFAGMNLAVQSLAADSLRIYRNVVYMGTISQTAIQTQVEAAINNYLSKLPFDGVVQDTSIDDAIQTVPGVVDIPTGYTQLNGQTINGRSTLPAGYAVIDGANPLSSTLTYVAI